MEENSVVNNLIDIIHQTTNPYTPEQNSISERMNITLVEKAMVSIVPWKVGKDFLEVDP